MNEKNVPLSSVLPSSQPTRLKSTWERYHSQIIWLLLVAYLGITAFLVTVIFEVEFIDRSQSGFFEPQGIISMGVMGMIGVWASIKTGFPQAWDARVSNKQRLVIPLIAGLVLGTLFLTTDLVTGLTRLQQEQLNLPATDTAFPASLFVYSAGSIMVEVVYRILPIPLLLGLVSIIVRGQSAREGAFWGLAVLTSLIEPLTNNAAAHVLGPLALTFVLLQSFGFNLLQAAFFRKYGFVAAILARVAFYIPFHIIGSFLK